MKVMLVNDDGYGAPGIEAMAEALKNAGHEVLVAAPDGQRSGSGQSVTLDGEVLHADRLYSVAMQKYHYNNLKPFLNITLEEAEQNGKIRVLSTSARDVVEEYLTVNQHLSREVEGRLVVEA